MKEKQEKSKEKTEQSKAVRKRKNGNVGLEDSHSETRVRNRKKCQNKLSKRNQKWARVRKQVRKQAILIFRVHTADV